MSDNLQCVIVTLGDNCKLRILDNRKRKVDQFAVDATRNRGLRQSGAYGCGNIAYGYRVFKGFLGAIGQGNQRHETTLSVVADTRAT